MKRIIRSTYTRAVVAKIKPVRYTLNTISNWPLFKLIIFDQALITLKSIFAYILAVNGQKFSGLLEKLSFNPRYFGWLSMQKYAFLNKNGF